MKRYPSLLVITLIALTVTAQKNKEEFYIFKLDWKPAASTKEAAYFARLIQLSDTCWQWDVYNYTGPLILSQRYKDQKQTQLHGRQHYFKPSGYIDSAGSVVNGMLNGDWLYFDDSARAVLKKKYLNGTLVEITDLTKKNDTTLNDTAFKDEHESSFPGGIKAWQKYLTKNLRYPERAQQAAVTGEVVAQFIVDKTGTVIDVDIFKSVEYSLDEETMRLIRNSPKWTPAVQNGKPVKSYKRQPLKYQTS